MTDRANVDQALLVLHALGLPRAQLNDRSALCLLALLDLRPGMAWAEAMSPLMGITPIMGWVREQYGKKWKPNTRETVRRQTMHQFVTAGLAVYNPDHPSRAVNSPKAVYQVAPASLGLLRTYGAQAWDAGLTVYLESAPTLAARYAQDREMSRIAVVVMEGTEIQLSPGEHSELIRAIVEDFGSRFVPGGTLIYAGDTGEKWAYFDEGLLKELGVKVDSHGKMPDVVLYDPNREWLFLVESVTSHGPVGGKRHGELSRLFSGARPRLVYVTAFPSRSVMARHLGEIAWETEVWFADAPSHLVHFNGDRFLGPH